MIPFTFLRLLDYFFFFLHFPVTTASGEILVFEISTKMNNIRQIQSLNKRELENAVLVRPA